MTTNNKPDVIDLSKNNDDDSTDGPDNPSDQQDYPEDVDDNTNDGPTDGPDAVSEEVRDGYPEDVEDNTDGAETDGPDDVAEAYNEDYPDELEGEFPGVVDNGDTDGVQGDTEKADAEGHVTGPAMDTKDAFYRLEDDEIYCEAEGEVFREDEADDGDCPHCDSAIAKSNGEDEKALNLGEYELQEKVEDTGFHEADAGDMVLIQTPLEGAKVGEVTDTEKSWTGTLQMEVDTGVNKYTVTPYDDEYSEKFCGVVSENKDVTHDLLGSLGKASPEAVERGDNVVIDAPTVGAVKGMVAHKTETETQGHKIDVKCGPVYFKIYEDTSAQQRKEMPYLVGKVTE